MTTHQSQSSSRALELLRRVSFKSYLKVVYGLRHVPGTSNAPLPRYGRVLHALTRFPLPDAQTAHYRTLPDHPQPLKTRAQVEESYYHTTALGLKPHKAREKNWDFLHAFSLITTRLPRNAVIVDMGTGSSESTILRWLALYGYRNLHGCDLAIEPYREGPIDYTVQNIEATTYPDAWADAITCLSVIEHGVDAPRFLAECYRMLKPGALLALSTDFWCEPLPVDGVSDEIGPVYVYDPNTIRTRILEPAAEIGLRVVGTPDFTCGDPVVNRPSVPTLHQRYTFYWLHFERPAE